MRLFLAFLLCAALATPLGTVAAQTCNITIYRDCGEPSHSAHTVEAIVGTRGGDDHGSTCMVCRNGPGGPYINASYCHPSGCEGEPADEGEGGGNNLTANINGMIDAAKRGNMVAAAAFAQKVPSRILVNWTRSSVQVLSCDRSAVIASIPMTQRSLAAFEHRLTVRYAGSPRPASSSVVRLARR
jgi:hypothetical protein